MNQDIDAVYLWVDGNDPEHIRLRQKYLTPFVPIHGNEANRWSNHNELRYSLRSLAAFAPWIRRVHIVTNGQVPPWLNLDNPKVQLVTHQQIFRWPEHLPTFNSVAIETHLLRIPDLAEQFIYFNDDMFLGSPCDPGLFFADDGRMRIRLWGNLPQRPKPGEAAWFDGMVNARNLLVQEFGPAYSQRLNHQAKPYTLTFLKWVEQRWPHIAVRNSAARFRSRTDVAMNYAFWGNCAVATGYALRITDARGLFVPLIGDGPSNRRVLKKLRRHRPKLFCINDTSEDGGTMSALQGFFNNYFPDPSEYERPSIP